MAARLDRVLTNDPGIGVARHADAGYDEAIAFASYVRDSRTESPVHPHAELVAVLATIDEVRAQLAAASEPRG